MLIKELKEILQDQIRIFSYTYFKSSPIHQLTIMYCFEYTNLDIILIFLFQNLYKLFSYARNLHH